MKLKNVNEGPFEGQKSTKNYLKDLLYNSEIGFVLQDRSGVYE